MRNSIKKISKKTIAILPLLAIALLLNPLLVQSTFAQMGGGDPVPHYFGPYPNYATSDLPTVTYNADGSIASITGGIQKFIDSLPLLGPTGASTLNNEYLPVAVADKTTYPGSDYYEIAAVEFYQQFHSDLPWTKLRGYVQLDTAAIPGAGVALTTRHPTSPTAINMPNGVQAIGVDIPRYLGPFIVAEKDVPVRVKFYNLLPTGAAGDLFLPVDTTVMGSGMGPIDDPMNPGEKLYYTQNRATLHLHGGRSPWISDGTAHQWITPANENTVYPKGVSVSNVPDMPDPGDGAMTFYYTNQQSARLMFYHDHSYGITRLNVYAGEAAGYVLRDAVEQSLISAGIIPGLVAGDEIPLVIQDKTFVPDTTTQFTNMYGTFASQLAFQDPTWDIAKWGGQGSLWYPHVYVPMQNPGDPSGMNLIGRWHYGPWFWPPTSVTYGPTSNPYAPGGALYDPMYAFNSFEPAQIPGVPNISAPGEAFMDTPVLNGVAYPYLEVQPQAYRFRILNAADDRFFNLQLYEASTGIISKIAVSNGGSGYTSAPAVTITGNGVGATARAVLDDAGTVSAVEILTVGSGYTVAPTVTITPPTSGTTATAYAQIYTLPTEVGMVPATPTSGHPDGWPIDGREGGVPDPTKAGPSFIQIGNEGGFLPAPVVLENQPIDWNVDMGTFDAGLINKGTLRLGTAERADVIVDFSQYAGKTLILYNDNPAPEPASDPRQDYYTGRLDMTEGGGCDPIMPGYGSNTRTIMQIRVADVAADQPYDLAGLETAFASTATTDGVFKQSQEHDIIIPQEAYSSAYNTAFTNTYSTIFANSLTFTPIGQTSPVTIDFHPKQIQDEMGESYDAEYGRMAVFLGTELIRSTAGQQTMLLYGYAEPPTELVKPSIEGTQIGSLNDGTQIWKITHNGVDVHTVHWHMFEVQLINRVAWDNNIRVPDANELGWKETIRVNPLQDTIVALRPIIPDLPFDLPNSERLIDPTRPEGVVLKRTFDPTGQGIILTNHLMNFGWEHVWHCHILAHEEMDMMRPMSIAVPPWAPYDLTVALINSNPTYRLTWKDNSLSETEFTVQRSTDAQTWTTIATIQSTTGATKGATISYDDTTGVTGTTYYFRVLATNVVGDSFDYSTTNPAAVGFPTLTVNSKASNIVSTAGPLGDVYIAVRGFGGGEIYQKSYVQASNSWSSWSALPTGSTIDTPATTKIGITQYYVVKGSDGISLWFTTRNVATGITSAWTWLSGSTPSAPTLVSDDQSLLALVVRGENNKIYYRIYDTATELWGNWNELPNALTSEKPTAAIIGSKLHIVVRGITLASNDLYEGTVNLGNGDFNGWTPLQGSTPSAPVLATTHLTNELFLAVRGEDNVIYLKNWNGITWDATWTPLPTGSTGFSPAIAVYGNNLQIVVIGMDGISLWHNSMDINTNAMSTWTPLSGSSPSAPTMTR